MKNNPDRKLTLIAYHYRTDITVLAKFHNLSLVWFDNLRDLSPLYNVRILSLESCHSIIDITPLRKVHTLKLINCSFISDVSALNHVYDLTIDYCQSIRDLSAFKDGTIHKLTLVRMFNLNLSPLRSVHHLELRDFYHSSMNIDVSGLNGIHTLKIINCRDLFDVSALGDVRNLTLEKCPHVRDVSALKRVPNLKIVDCYGVIQWFGMYLSSREDTFLRYTAIGIGVACWYYVWYKAGVLASDVSRKN